MSHSVDAVFLKQEYCDLPVHVTLDLNADGYLSDVKPAVPLNPDPVVASSRINSACPACQCFISINIIVHGSLEEKIVLKELEPVVKEEEPGISSDEYENIEPLTIIHDFEDSKKDIKDDELETVIKDKTAPKRKSDSKNNSSSKKAKIKKTPPKTKPKKTEKAAERVIFCVYCFKVFETRLEQKEHIRNHDFCCNLCDPPVFFATLDPVRLHYRHKHFDLHPLRHETETCPKCNLVFRSTQFKSHIDSCVPWHCEICNKTFNKRETFKKHKLNVHGNKVKPSYTCDICGKVYHQKSLFNIHYLTHTDDPNPIKCDLCSSSFRNKASIKHHIETIHLNMPEPRVDCTECGQSVRVRKLREHMVHYHIRGKVFKCSYCGKGFTTKKFRLDHEKIHTDDRPFPCEVCTQSFRRKAELKCHMRLHTSEKPYQCEICQQRFHDRGCYRSHIIKHEKELGITLDKSVKKFSTKPTQ